MTPIELNRELESDKFRPVYYFFGKADFRIKEAEKAVVRRFLPKSQLVTNHTSLSARKLDLGEILTALSIFPLIGEKQAFTISDIQSFSPAEIEKILSLLTPSDPNRIVILSSPSEKTPEKKTKTFALLVKKTAAVEFKRIPEVQSEKKILSILREQEIQIDPEALQALVILGGGDTGGLTEELNKLINYIGRGGRIRKEDISKVCSDYQAFEIHELTNAIVRGNLSQALEMAGMLLAQGGKASGLLYSIGEHFVDLYLLSNNKPLPPRKKGTEWKFRDQTRLFNNAQLEKSIELIASADFDLKNSIRPENLIIERLIINICYLRRKKALYGQKISGR